jgi:tRNA(Ile2) C34 agmatinyltransferase TiaS
MREPTDQEVCDYAEQYDLSMLEARTVLRAELNTKDGEEVDYRKFELLEFADDEAPLCPDCGAAMRLTCDDRNEWSCYPCLDGHKLRRVGN